MMLRDVLTEAEWIALLGMNGKEATGETLSSFENDEKKLIHALVRNQLRLLRMIEELQAEVRRLKAHPPAEEAPPAHRETAAALQPLPLPFLKRPQRAWDETREAEEGPANAGADDDERKAPAADVSRKERFKRRSLW